MKWKHFSIRMWPIISKCNNSVENWKQGMNLSLQKLKSFLLFYIITKTICLPSIVCSVNSVYCVLLKKSKFSCSLCMMLSKIKAVTNKSKQFPYQFLPVNYFSGYQMPPNPSDFSTTFFSDRIKTKKCSQSITVNSKSLTKFLITVSQQMQAYRLWMK